MLCMKNTHLLFLGPYISAAAASNGKEYPFRLLGSSPNPRPSTRMCGPNTMQSMVAAASSRTLKEQRHSKTSAYVSF